MTFPADKAGKAQLWSEVKATAPDVVVAVNTLRDSFDGAALGYLKINGVEYGKKYEGISLDVVLQHYPGTDEEWAKKNPQLIEQNRRVMAAVTKSKGRRRK